MRVLIHMLRKEFLQIFRNKGMLPIIFVAPLVQLLVLVHAADFEVRNVRLTVSDMDGSRTSQALIGRFTASDRFHVTVTHNGFTGNMRNDRRKVPRTPSCASPQDSKKSCFAVATAR
jgi:hypothetical protein